MLRAMKSEMIVKGPTLLTLSEDVSALLKALDDSPDDSILADALAASGGALAAKVDGYCAVRAELEARAIACRTEADRLEAVARACGNAVDRLKSAAKLAAARLGVERLKGDRGSITVSRVETDAIDVLDEAKVPDKFKTTVITHKVSKDLIAKGVVYDETAGTVADRETGEDLSQAVRIRPVFAVRFK